MPIRLNLLAEAQAEEDLRRRDPVKRVLWVGVLGVVIVLGWSSSLLLRTLIVRGELNRLEAQVAARTNEYRQVIENQGNLTQVRHRLVSLRQLATNRFLQAPVLNSLQKAVVADVQLTRYRTDLSYAIIQETKAATNADGQIAPGRKGSATEKISITMDARDSGVNAGDQIPRFKQAIATAEFFQKNLGPSNEVRLAKLSPPEASPSGKPHVLFTLECRLPEKVR
jgi:hypothetical protein